MFISKKSLLIMPIIIFFAFIASGYGKADFIIPDFYLQSEYRKDSIDYSETENVFYREKVKILFSRESSLNLTYIYIDEFEENKYTYSLVLSDISPHASFVIGNYFVNFGHGLLIGRKRLYNPDVFSSRMNVASRKIFMPCGSGNPVFAFNGICVSFKAEVFDFNISMNSFYSLKERFIDLNSYNQRITSSSMNTIEQKRDRDYKYSELIDMHTHGSMLFVDVMDLFFFEAYYLLSGLRSISDKRITWDLDGTNTYSYGTSRLLGSGFVLEYRDESLSLFFEGALTKKETESELVETGHSENEDIYGRGMLYGIRFTPPFLAVSIIGKDVGSNFYSPYSSSIGEDYPENAWFFDVEIRPFRNLKVGTSISSQRKSSVTSSFDKELPDTQREAVHLHYSYKILKALDIKLRKMEKKKEDNETKFQFKESAKIEIFKHLMLKLFNIYQRGKDVRPSRMFGIGAALLIYSRLKINTDYLKGYIAEGNAIYSAASPIRHSNIQGFFIRETANIIVIRSAFKYKKLFLSCRFFYQFDRKRTIHKRMEFAGSGYF